MDFDYERYMSDRMDDPIWLPATSGGAAIVPAATPTGVGDIVTVLAPGVLGVAVELVGRWWNTEGGLHSVGDASVMVVIAAANGVFAGMLAGSSPRASVVFGSLGLTVAASGVIVFSGGLAAAVMAGVVGLGAAYANVMRWFTGRSEQRKAIATAQAHDRTMQQDRLGARLETNRYTNNTRRDIAVLGLVQTLHADQRVDAITARLAREYGGQDREQVSDIRAEKIAKDQQPAAIPPQRDAEPTLYYSLSEEADQVRR